MLTARIINLCLSSFCLIHRTEKDGDWYVYAKSLFFMPFRLNLSKLDELLIAQLIGSSIAFVLRVSYAVFAILIVL